MVTNKLPGGCSLQLCEQACTRGAIPCHSELPQLCPQPPLAELSLHFTSLMQIGKLRSELEVVNGNTKVMSEMLTELVPSQAEPSDLELLQVRNTGLGGGVAHAAQFSNYLMD